MRHTPRLLASPLYCCTTTKPPTHCPSAGTTGGSEDDLGGGASAPLFEKAVDLLQYTAQALVLGCPAGQGHLKRAGLAPQGWAPWSWRPPPPVPAEELYRQRYTVASGEGGFIFRGGGPLVCVLGLGRGRGSFLPIPRPALSPAASLPGSHDLTPPAWGAAPPHPHPTSPVTGWRGPVAAPSSGHS